MPSSLRFSTDSDSIAKSSRSRPSLFTRFIHRLVPCVSSAALEDSFVPELSKDASHEMQQVDPLPPPAIQPDVGASTGEPDAGPSTSEPDAGPSTSEPDAGPDGVTSSAVQPPGSTASDTVHDDDVDRHQEPLITSGGTGIPIGPDGQPKPLLPPILPEHAGRKCLVLDLDETLVHSSFKAVQNADFVVPVEIEYHWHHFHVLKRPGVDEFLKRMGELYEVVVFTASLSKYADPVLDQLDVHRAVTHRLFRESCYSHKGNYVKDLSQLGRPIADTIIIDNSPASYIFHPHNAVPVSSWFNDPHDAELTDLVPFLADMTAVPDVRGILNDSQ